MHQVQTSRHVISIEGADQWQVRCSSHPLEPGVDLVRLTLLSDTERPVSPIRFVFRHPIVDLHAYWHPAAFRNKYLEPEFVQGFRSMATVSAPVGCFHNVEGRNRLTVALSDALNVARFDLGVREEDAALNLRITLFAEPVKPMSSYEVELRLDVRDIPWHESLRDVSRWWETFAQYAPSPVPECARLPMYSTWYSFHQRLVPEEIETQCRLAREMGCEAVIIDDGWQTSDSNRGYAYCGDWELSPDRIPDMKAFADRVHRLGMKLILWYSVPFVGVHSKAWEKFRDKLLDFLETEQAGVLDPRYPEVREYLIETYERALAAWDLDGFKLDFVDQFYLREHYAGAAAPGRDFESVQEATDRLLTDVMARLRAIKPDIMIEFRQRYIGPLMRKYGNMFRAADCPNDAITNRMETLDVRMLAWNTAVHSDMIMWNPAEPVESAALQLVNVLFSVPQISVRLDRVPSSHAEMIRFWLAFWREHRDVLLDGALQPRSPELMYPLVRADAAGKRAIAVYAPVLVPSGDKLPELLILVNGTLQKELALKLEEDIREGSIRVCNCLGETVSETTAGLERGVHVFDVPPAGVVLIRKAPHPAE